MTTRPIKSQGGSKKNNYKPLPSDTELDTNSSKRINSNLVKYSTKKINKNNKKINGLYGYGVVLPLAFSGEGPYGLHVNLSDQIAQNFKNLILTEPGERVMDVNFGVGLKRYLFEQNSDSLYNTIEARIRNQTSKYMSFLAIDNIEFEVDSNDPNYLGVTIYYNVSRLSIEGNLFISTDGGIIQARGVNTNG